MMSLKSPRSKDFRCRQIGYEAISYSRQRRLEIPLFSFFFFFQGCLFVLSFSAFPFFLCFFFLSFKVDTQCCNSPSFLSSENQKIHTFFFFHLVSDSYKLSSRADGMMFQRTLQGYKLLIISHNGKFPSTL